jgi:broad specificity phosphatase PhoE
MEGQTITPDLLKVQDHLTTEAPDTPVPGRGPLSTADGESFNSFKDRTLSKLKELIDQHQSQPDRRIGVVTHYRVKKLLEAWMRRGLNPDGQVDNEFMTQPNPSNTPGGIERFSVDPNTGPQIDNVDLKSPASLMGGLYFIRHEATPWNAEQGS